MAQETALLAKESDASSTIPVAPFEERNPLPGITFWGRGDGAFSITYAPPLNVGMSVDEMFSQMRTWLDEREAKFRR